MNTRQIRFIQINTLKTNVSQQTNSTPIRRNIIITYKTYVDIQYKYNSKKKIFVLIILVIVINLWVTKH